MGLTWTTPCASTTPPPWTSWRSTWPRSSWSPAAATLRRSAAWCTTASSLCEAVCLTASWATSWWWTVWATSSRQSGALRVPDLDVADTSSLMLSHFTWLEVCCYGIDLGTSKERFQSTVSPISTECSTIPPGQTRPHNSEPGGGGEAVPWRPGEAGGPEDVCDEHRL